MSTLLTDVLLDQDTGGLYRRKDVRVMDTSSTSLPAAGPTLPTVDGVVQHVGDLALFTALTSGANKVYKLREDSISGQITYSYAASDDSRYSSDARHADGSPTPHDCMRCAAGSHAGKMLMWDGSAWQQPSVADDSAAAAAVAATAAATDAQTPSTIMKRDSLGATSVACKSGATGSRPVVTTTGYMFFDTTLHKPIWWSGSAWVDATGTSA